jgi:ubiquinone/menaquinone biosynthesis C-methylase UbiE
MGDRTYPRAMSDIEPHESMWRRERDFHDALAAQMDVNKLREEWAPDRLDLALMNLAGDVREQAVLDAGCGQGDMTLHLLASGAMVTSLDVSSGMIEVVRARVRRMVGDCRGFTAVAGPLEHSGLPDASFDLILGKFILHHIDVPEAAAEIKRLLRPGGRAIFIENGADNRLLAVARERFTGRWGVPRYGTEDEHPLTGRDLDVLRGVFSQVEAHYPIFECLVLFDRQVLHFRYPRVSRMVRKIDDGVHRRCPTLRRFSYRVVVELTE